MSNVIIGMCFGYTANQIEPFIRSCRKYNDCKIVFFSGNCSPDAYELMRSNDIEIIEVSKSKHPESDRFSMYLEYLQNSEAYEKVFFADVRDIVFQGDVFATNLKDDDIFFFEEEVDFKDAETQQSWQTTVYDEELTKSYSDYKVICAGTTLAGTNGALKYLEAMAAGLSAIPKKEFGVDQAVHNYLYYNKVLPNITLFKNRNGIIQTVGLQKDFLFNSNGKLLNQDGSVPAVIHQYDRHYVLVNAFDEERSLDIADMRRLRTLTKSRSAAIRNVYDIMIDKTFLKKRRVAAAFK